MSKSGLKKPSIGVWASAATWDLEVALERLRIDYLVADCQHGSWSYADLERFFRGLGLRAPSHCRPLVRTNVEPSAAEIGHYLDAGAWGLIVPFAADERLLRAARKAMHYPPVGTRSVARNIGLYNTNSDTLDGYIEWSRGHLSLYALIESRSALDHIDDILQAADGVIFGLKDLSLGLGLSLADCIDLIATRLHASRADKPIGYLGVEPARQLDLGADIINLGNVKDFIQEAVAFKLQQLGIVLEGKQ